MKNLHDMMFDYLTMTLDNIFGFQKTCIGEMMQSKEYWTGDVRSVIIQTPGRDFYVSYKNGKVLYFDIADLAILTFEAEKFLSHLDDLYIATIQKRKNEGYFLPDETPEQAYQRLYRLIKTMPDEWLSEGTGLSFKNGRASAYPNPDRVWIAYLSDDAIQIPVLRVDNTLSETGNNYYAYSMVSPIEEFLKNLSDCRRFKVKWKEL